MKDNYKFEITFTAVTKDNQKVVFYSKVDGTDLTEVFSKLNLRIIRAIEAIHEEEKEVSDDDIPF